MSKEIKADVIDPKAVENTSRRIGLQSKLAEKVVDATEDKQVQKTALSQRVKATGEPSAAPRFEDAGK